jgi:hypothetical protein
MRLSLIIISLLSPLLTFAQSGTITGKIFNAETQAPLARASVFVSGTTYGVITENDGTFSLKGLKPDKYLLIVTMIGFEKFSQTVSIGTNAAQVNISLKPYVTTLREVTVQNPKDWARNYKTLVKWLIGDSKYGRKCKILNSEVLSFIYNKKDKELSAWSDDFIKMENRALGYMVKILLTKSTFIENGASYNYQMFFEELPGTPREIKQWKANRIELSKDFRSHFPASEKLPSDYPKAK